MTYFIRGALQASALITEYAGYELLETNNHGLIERPLHPVEEKVYQLFIDLLLHRDHPLIFLDIDGVLNDGVDEVVLEARIEELFPRIVPYTLSHVKRAASDYLDEKALSQLNHLLTRFPEATIVISSDWRLECSLLEIRDIFRQHAFSERILDKTPDHIDQEDKEDATCKQLHKRREHNHTWCKRSRYIHAWLRSHPQRKNYLVIDDYDLSAFFQKRFIQVDDKKLFTQADREKAEEILGPSSHPFFNRCSIA